VQIVCFGEGPVVHVLPPALDWGQVTVLVDSPKTLRLSNESLIPANFMAKLVSTFRVKISR
jgi:hydrocephalus-inducing protein